MKVGYIYKITYLIENKCYVGQTIRDLDKRWREHVVSSKKESPRCHIHKAIKKYGVENFVCEKIETVPIDILNLREIYWIERLNTFGNNGFNETLGGNGARGYKMNDTLKQYFSELFSGEGNPFYGKTHSEITKQRISYCNSGKIPWNLNIPHTEIAKKNISLSKSGKQSWNKGVYNRTGNRKPVKQYSIQDEFIAEFETASEASRQLDIHSNTIIYCCNGKRKTAGGFKWKY